MRPTGIDLFSGCGGFTTGALQAGAEVVWAANHWTPAVNAHARNHPGVVHVEQNLSEFDWTLAPDCDLLLASPACQGWSQAGQPARQGTGGSHRPSKARARAKGQGDRNTSWAVLAAADTLRPRHIVVENVTDMQDKWGATFDAWLGVLQSMGYATAVHRLWAHEYGGAQERLRLVVTASLDGPIHLQQTVATDGPTIGECLQADDDAENRWRDLATMSPRMLPLMRKAQRQAGKRCFWANVSESRGRALDERFPTATTQSGTQWYLLDGERGRILNPREIARSMSFADDYWLPANREVAGKMIGNAIDVAMARNVVGQVLAAN